MSQGVALVAAGAATRVTHGTRPAGAGSTLSVAFDLYDPPHAPTSLVVLVHGFAGRKEHLSAHAERLCAHASAVVLNVDMSTLISPSPSAAQARNIAGVVEHVLWCLSSQPALSDKPLWLYGHSAGGAVALEAAVALRRGGVAVHGVCLLDGVPWPRTEAVAATQLFAHGSGAGSHLPPPAVLSLRSEPSAWNLHGKMLGALQAGVAAARGGAVGAPRVDCVDALLRGSRHGDPVSDPAFRGCATRAMGLCGPPACAELYGDLLLACAQGRAREALAALPAGVAQVAVL